MLILHHGRGSDERDLLPVAEALDPERLWHVVSPQAPLTIPGWPGHHWYRVPRVGYPDPASFAATVSLLGEFHDHVWARTGIAPSRTVLGGFSMGAVISYALGLHPERPAPAGIMALSGFVPTVEGWAPSLEDRPEVRVFIAHGRYDSTIAVEFARRAHEQLLAAGLSVEYHETDADHHVDPAYLPAAIRWLATTMPAMLTADG